MNKIRRFNDILERIYTEGSKSRWVKTAIILICAFIVSLFLSREVFLKTLVFGDYPLVTLESSSVIEKYVLQGWYPSGYGSNYPVPLAYLFLDAFSQIAAFFGTVQVFNFLMNISFPLSFIAFYYFSGKFCKSLWLRILGSALYLVNPAVITYYNTGGFIWTFVFLPFALSFFMDLLEKQTKRNLAKATVFTALTMWAFPSLSVVLAITFATIAGIYFLYSQPKIPFLKTAVPRILVFLLLIFVLNASFFYAQYRYNQSPSYGLGGESVLNDFKYAYQLMSVDNLLRLGGNLGSPQAPLGYNDFSLTNAVGFILPITALASIFWLWKHKEKKREVAAMLASIAVILALTLFIETLTYTQLNGVITSTSWLWTLRNPLKLQLMLAVCMIPLSIFSLEKIKDFTARFVYRKKYLTSTLALALILLGISQIYVYNAFAFNGYAGIDKTYSPPNSYSPNQNILNILKDASAWSQEGDYRGIILPFDHDTELHVEFNNLLLYPSRLGVTSAIVEQLSNTMNTSSNLVPLLSLLSTKYVYINDAWVDTRFHIINPPDLGNLTESLTKENLAKIVSSNYTRFTVENALPHIYLSNYPVFFSDASDISLLNSSVLSSRPIALQMTEAGLEAENSDSASSSAVKSFEANLPLKGVYDVCVTTKLGDLHEFPINCSIDDETINNDRAILEADKLNHITTISLNEGVHRITVTSSIRGIMLLPVENQKDIPITFAEKGSSRYLFEYNQTGESPLLLFGENYDNGWEATIDGKRPENHFKANFYANCWLTNTGPGSHQVEIRYRYNTEYQAIVAIDILLMTALVVAAYIPMKTLTKLIWKGKKQDEEQPQR